MASSFEGAGVQGEERLNYLGFIFKDGFAGLARHSFYEPFALPNGEEADEVFLSFATEAKVFGEAELAAQGFGPAEVPVVGYEVHFSFVLRGEDCKSRIRWLLQNNGETEMFEIKGGAETVLHIQDDPAYSLKKGDWNSERYISLFDHLLTHFMSPYTTTIIEPGVPEFASYAAGNKPAFRVPK